MCHHVIFAIDQSCKLAIEVRSLQDTLDSTFDLESVPRYAVLFNDGLKAMISHMSLLVSIAAVPTCLVLVPRS